MATLVIGVDGVEHRATAADTPLFRIHPGHLPPIFYSPGPGAPPRHRFDSPGGHGAWTDALLAHPARPDGILYASRHDPDELCVALFSATESDPVIAEGPTSLADMLRPFAALLHRYGKGVSPDRRPPGAGMPGKPTITGRPGVRRQWCSGEISAMAAIS